MKSQAEILKQAFSYQDQLTAYAFVVLQDWSLAEDVVQDLFVTVSVKWESFDSSKALYPWLKRIVRNRAIDIIRSRSKEFYCHDQSLLDLVDQSFAEGDQELTQERYGLMKNVLRSCLESLSEQSRKLLKGFYNDGKSCIELARLESKTENAVYISLTRIRQQLRKCADSKLSQAEDW
jgi:RNA polymerase sigma factor (sigma-70 family)